MARWTGGKLITDGDMSADISTSLVIDVLATGRLENGRMSIQAIAPSATHVGTLSIQLSNDETNWEDVVLDDGTTSVAAASGSAFAELIAFRVPTQFVRVFYTFSSGVGVLQVTPFGKGL